MPKKDKKSDRPLPAPPQGAAPIQEFDMVFNCQMAHGSATRQVRDFTNVQQLYESIAKAFGIPTGDILYCTLNTHLVDMTKLLGGQIGLEDFLFAHVVGETKTVKVHKDGPALGLTISDNGAGYAFIKKIREDSIMARAPGVTAGDHIAAINGTDLVGSRHFEVARMLKEIPIGSEFSLKLVSPKAGMQVGQRTALASGATKEVKPGEGRKTLRMKANGTAEVFQEVEDASLVAQNALIHKIDTLLESHIGIRDVELSRTMYNLAKEAKEADQFAGKLDEELTDFEFPDDFVLDVFEAVHPEKK